MIRISLLQGGYCTHSRKMVLTGEANQTCQFPSLFAVIEHPQEGLILYDTGYSDHFFKATRRYPYRVYAQITPVFLEPAETAAAQLRARGMDPNEVKYIIVSHFHGDHVAGLKDFPKARFICLHQGYEQIRSLKGIAATRKGVLPGLMPDDFERRAWFIDREHSPLRVAPVVPFAYTYDLFGDGLIRLIPLEGHFCGQLGALLQTQQGPCFLIADACWLREGYLEQRLPHPVAMTLMNNPAQYRQDLADILSYHQAHPNTAIVPSHCIPSIADFVAAGQSL
jgi:glyoxylase-like metal-dependent hydrolase (beta-lactamase superfamily II)